MTRSSANKNLKDYKILIFDVYGTLCDWETGLYNALQPLVTPYRDKPSDDTTATGRDNEKREILTQFIKIEGELQKQGSMTYQEVLAKSYSVLEERLRLAQSKTTATAAVNGINKDIVPSPSAIAFSRSIRQWPVFSDSQEALARLAQHFKIVVLSNVDNESFGWTHRLLSCPPSDETDTESYAYPSPNPNRFWHPHQRHSPFTVIFTAQDVKSYKPSPEAFRTVLDYIRTHPELFGIDQLEDDTTIEGKVASVAQSLTHDIAPAREMALGTLWIDRKGAVTCNEGNEKWDWRFETVGEMADFALLHA